VAVTDGPVLVEGLAYPEATGYLTIEPGTYPLEIRAAGEAEAALTLDATLEAGQNYTAIAMDGGEAGVQVIVATEAMTMPDTAMGQPAAPLGAIGGVLIALAALTGLRLAVSRARA
jgi:hypothetical protein